MLMSSTSSYSSKSVRWHKTPLISKLLAGVASFAISTFGLSAPGFADEPFVCSTPNLTALTDADATAEVQVRLDNPDCDVVSLVGSKVIVIPASLALKINGSGAPNGIRDVKLVVAEGSDITFDASSSASAIVFESTMDVLRVEGLTFTGATDSAILNLTGASNQIHVTGSTFTANDSSNDGGAIMTVGTLNLYGTNNFDDNYAADEGGAIFAQGIAGEGSTANFSGNTSGTRGGAISSPSGPVALGSLSIVGSSSNEGGGVYAQSLNLTSAAFLENSATDGDGGSVFVVEDMTVGNMSASTSTATGSGGSVFVGGNFTANSVAAFRSTTTGEFGKGGLIHSEGNFSASTLAVSEGSAESHGGAVSAGGTLTITASIAAAGVSSRGQGGMLYSVGSQVLGGVSLSSVSALGSGGALYSSDSVTIRGDVALSAVSSGGTGGAIFANNAVELEKSIVAVEISSIDGGGTIASVSSTVTILGSLSIVDSTSQDVGGVIYGQEGVFLNSAAVVDGSSTGSGGCFAALGTQAKFIATGSISLLNCDSSTGSGGAIYASGGVELADVSISGSSASQDGGAISAGSSAVEITGTATFSSNHAGGIGGAIFADSVQAESLSLFGNTADQAGGAIGALTGSLTISGLLAAAQNSSLGSGGVGYVGVDIILNEVQASGNSAGTTGGVFSAPTGDLTATGPVNFSGNNADGAGGAISVGGDLTFTGSESHFSGNTSVLGGGALFTPSGLLTSTGNMTFSGNEAAEEGGAVVAGGGASLNTATFSSNVSMTYGGAIYSPVENVSSTGLVKFDNNFSGIDGGAIYGGVDLAVANFTANVAVGKGGAISSGTELQVGSGSRFSANNAVTGGAIFYSSAQPLILDGVGFDLNVADFGGAIYSGPSTTHLLNSSFYGNEAADAGGAVLADSLIAFNSYFAQNTVTGNGPGGGAAIVYGTFEGAFNTFHENSGPNANDVRAVTMRALGNAFDSVAEPTEPIAANTLIDLGGNILAAESSLAFNDQLVGVGSEALGYTAPEFDATFGEGRYLTTISDTSAARDLVSRSDISNAISSSFSTEMGELLQSFLSNPQTSLDIRGESRASERFDAGAFESQVVTPVASIGSYLGPIIYLPADLEDLIPGQKLLLAGANLLSVESLSLGGKDAQVLVLSDESLEITVPELIPGEYQIEVLSSFGLLLVQPSVTIASATQDLGINVSVSVKRMADNTARIFAKDVVGAGKIQFMLNGREIAWVRATDETDPKLRFANNSYYLVRNRALAEGKNVIEIYIDGERVRRVSYTR